MAITITDYAGYSGGNHTVEIDIPSDTLFPLDDLSFPVGLHVIARAGDAKAPAQDMLAVAERTDYWKDLRARAAQSDLFGARATLDAPTRSRGRRPVVRRSAPRR